MKSALERMSDVARTFKAHFRNEMLSNPAIAKEIEGITSKISASSPARIFSKLYRSLQFGDFLVSEIMEGCSMEHRHSETKQSVVDPFFARTLGVPQYYGGIRQIPLRPSLLTRMLDWIAGLTGNGRIRDCIEDYKVLEQIQNEHVPNVLLELFRYGNLESIAFPEARESLKKLRTAILESRPEWTDREVVLDDIRQVEVESVSVKSLQKTVRCAFEFSTLLKGRNNKRAGVMLKKHFSGVLEFVKDDGVWKAASFTFSEF